MSFLVLGAVLLFLSGCRRDPPAPGIIGTVLKLKVEPTWNGAPFHKTTVYLTPTGQRVRMTLVKFYLADFTLRSDDHDVRLFEADLFDVTDGTQTRILQAPAGIQQELIFGVGLPPALNHADITDIPPNAPLGNNSGMYWSWADFYRFLIFEGHFDNDPEASGEPSFNFSIHTGFDTCYRTRSIPVDLQPDADDTMRLTLNVDLARFFSSPTDTLDLGVHAQWHGDADSIAVALTLADLERDAFSVQ